MSPRSEALHVEIANRRLAERRRRASTAGEFGERESSRWPWLVALAAAVGAVVFFL